MEMLQPDLSVLLLSASISLNRSFNDVCDGAGIEMMARTFRDAGGLARML